MGSNRTGVEFLRKVAFLLRPIEDFKALLMVDIRNEIIIENKESQKIPTRNLGGHSAGPVIEI